MSRSDRARVTRRRIIETASRLFEADGYGATTMEGVAGGAGVAVQTVYYIFGTKGRLLCEAMEYAAAGTHDPTPVQERAWMAEAMSARSALRSLAVAVDRGTDIYQRAAPLWPAVKAAAISDPAVADYWEGVTSARRAGMRRLVATLSDLSGLRGGLDLETAADVMFAVNSHAMFQALVIESGWSLPTFKGWLYATLVDQLLPSLERDQTATEGLGFSEWIEPGTHPRRAPSAPEG